MRKAIFLSLAVALGLLITSAGVLAVAQGPQDSKAPSGREKAGKEPGPRPGMEGNPTFGAIVSVGVDRLEIKKMDGSALTVKVDDQTRFRQGQDEITLEDLKAGDRVMVRGRPGDDKDFVAFMVRRVTEEEMQRFQEGGPRTGGEIVAIENGQLKIRNPMQGEKTIVVNDQTTVMKEGQPITLKDLKVGDRIFVVGKETDGQFVATRIMTGQFPGGTGGMGGGRRERRDRQPVPKDQ